MLIVNAREQIGHTNASILCLRGAQHRAHGPMHIRPARAFWPSPRSRLSCQRRDQVMSWLNRPRAAAQTAPWARRGKDRADPRHTAAPQAGPPPAPTPAPEPARDLRPSIRDMIDWSIHQRADTIVEGLSVRLYVQKKGAFNRVGQQAPIEFRGKTTKDVAVQHCIDILRIRLTTTFDRCQLNAAKWF